MQRVIAVGIVLLALSAALFAQSPHASVESSLAELQKVYQQRARELGDSLVMLVSQTPAGNIPVGTGFFVASDGLFITANHVLTAEYPNSSGLRAAVVLPSGELLSSEIEVVRLDKPHDLVLCRLRIPDDSKPVFHALKLGVAEGSLPGTFVSSAGFALGSGVPTYHFGYVARQRLRPNTIEFDMMLSEGESGAPVVEILSGKVIAMALSVRMANVYGTHALGQQNSGIAVGVPVEQIKALLAAEAKAAVDFK